ncbi:MAG: hypothetical protein ACJ8EI_03130 [Sphingomicrobium sp.]
MSPLWSDLALARAALADAVSRGLVDEPAGETKDQNRRPRIRRIPRRRTASFAL